MTRDQIFDELDAGRITPAEATFLLSTKGDTVCPGEEGIPSFQPDSENAEASFQELCNEACNKSFDIFNGIDMDEHEKFLEAKAAGVPFVCQGDVIRTVPLRGVK